MNRLSHRLGVCTVCGERIYSNQNFVKSEDGFCCHDCLTERYQVEV